MQKNIEIQKKHVDKEREIASTEAAAAKVEKDKATGIKYDCDKALEAVMPIYNKAVKAVKDLKAADITEMRGTKVPSAGLLLVAKVLCQYFNTKPKIIRGQTAKEGNTEDFWEPCQKSLLKPDLLQKMTDYPKDNIEQSLIDVIQPTLDSAEYTEKKMETTSKAALGISNWTKAIASYHEAMKVVRPK